MMKTHCGVPLHHIIVRTIEDKPKLEVIFNNRSTIGAVINVTLQDGEKYVAVVIERSGECLYLSLLF
jgi:hypothetical protein